ncbi:MAG: GGDEF domain-containing protein, partial [candidate division Zixibacteria bacterium]|nr:GGDEF domain-containing protein [candidate division Zixibacteria bacterium]
ILSLTLVTRIRSEKKMTAALRGTNLAEFSDFLLANSLDGDVQVVARKVSDLLKAGFACEKIIFLRKKRNNLELNYYHGVRGFNRRDFRLNHSRKFFEELRDDFRPRPVGDLAGVVPATFIEELEAHGLDLFFPIYWRDNLYGVYFVRSSIYTGSPAFRMLTASLAQSLSAAYHIKWHETKLSSLEHQLMTKEAELGEQTGSEKLDGSSILELVKCRNSEEIVPRVICAIKDDLKIESVAYAYQSKDDTSNLRLFMDGVEMRLAPPGGDAFLGALKAVDQGEMCELASLAETEDPVGEWAAELLKAGLECLSLYPLSSTRSGLLAWKGNHTESTMKRLATLRSHTVELVDNAESYELAHQLSFTDALTGLANQRYLFKRLDEELSRAKRYQRNLGLIFFDLDQLKIINDNHGHLAGDAILRQMGDILRKSIRSIDIIARYGGDEFCILMPEVDAETCVKFMQRLKTGVAESRFCIDDDNLEIGCTVSLGAAIFPQHADDPKSLMHNADMALLQAKDTGRNRFVLFEPEQA